MCQKFKSLESADIHNMNYQDTQDLIELLELGKQMYDICTQNQQTISVSQDDHPTNESQPKMGHSQIHSYLHGMILECIRINSST